MSANLNLIQRIERPDLQISKPRKQYNYTRRNLLSLTNDLSYYNMLVEMLVAVVMDWACYFWISTTAAFKSALMSLALHSEIAHVEHNLSL